jgi:hypothetical protein
MRISALHEADVAEHDLDPGLRRRQPGSSGDRYDAAENRTVGVSCSPSA